MPVNKEALLRYRIIDSCLRKTFERYVSLERIKQECFQILGTEVSDRTLKADLEAMRHDEVLGYLAPIEYSYANKGYFYTDENYSIEKLPFTEADTQAVLFAVNMLGSFRRIPLLEQFQGAVDKLFNALHTYNKNSKENSRIVEIEASPEVKGGEWIAPLVSAITKQQVIELRYQSFARSDAILYTLHPYLIKEYRSRWYLLAWDEQKNKIKTFGLDRTLDVLVKQQSFHISSEFNPELYFKYSYGITYHDDDPIEVHLKFIGPSCHYVLSKPLHNSQEIMNRIDQQLEIRLRVIVSYELIADILSFGDSCEVLGPPQLIRQVKHSLQQTLKKY